MHEANLVPFRKKICHTKFEADRRAIRGRPRAFKFGPIEELELTDNYSDLLRKLFLKSFSIRAYMLMKVLNVGHAVLNWTRKRRDHQKMRFNTEKYRNNFA